MDGYRTYVVPGIAGLVLLAYWVLAPKLPGEEQPPSTPGSTAPTGPESLRGGARPLERTDDGTVPRPDEVTPRDPSAAGDPKAAPRATLRDRKVSDALRETLRARMRARQDASPAVPEPEAKAVPEPVVPALDAEYIRTRIGEDLVPIAEECYASALEDDPRLGGKLIVNFAIVGDDDVGGVVEAAEIDPASELQHEALHECVRESMLSLSFVPPEGAGRVVVTYPFVFAPEAPPP